MNIIIQLLTSINPSIGKLPSYLGTGWAVWSMFFFLTFIILSTLTIWHFLNRESVELGVEKGRNRGKDIERGPLTGNIRPTSWRKVTLEGVDSQLNTVRMEAFVLDPRYFWKYEGTKITDRSGNSVDLLEHLDDERLRRALINSKDVVCLGLAPDCRTNESGIARQRADILARFIRKTGIKLKSVYDLTCCEYQIPESEIDLLEESIDFTIPLRRIAYIGVIQYSSKANIKEAIEDALRKSKNFPINGNSYLKITLKVN